MLYKKYHRNYVKQFKKGVKFDIISVEEVWKEPWYDNVNKIIYITGSKYGRWDLVFPNGKVEYNIKIEKDAI